MRKYHQDLHEIRFRFRIVFLLILFCVAVSAGLFVKTHASWFDFTNLAHYSAFIQAISANAAAQKTLLLYTAGGGLIGLLFGIAIFVRKSSDGGEK